VFLSFIFADPLMWIRSACLDTIRTGIRSTECQVSPDSCMNLSLRLLTDRSALVNHNRNFLLGLSDRLPQQWRSDQLLVFRPCFSLQMLVLHRVTQIWINLAARIFLLLREYQHCQDGCWLEIMRTSNMRFVEQRPSKNARKHLGGLKQPR
jgi:hypothetical protein